MHLPLITLVMPSYNQCRYLEEAIVSVIEQSYKNVEFIIIDGGSQDGSKEIIERYSKYLHYWQSEADQGQSDALVQGFKRSSGELLGWLNSDDLLLPGALHAIAHAARRRQDYGMYGGNFILLDYAGKIRRCKRLPSQAEWFARRGVFVVGQPGSFFRRADYDRVGGLNTQLNLVMDTDLYVRMLVSGTRFLHLDRYVSAFRAHPGGKTTAYKARVRPELRLAQQGSWPPGVALAGQQLRWMLVYSAFQLVNGNYLRMSLETARSRGRPWWELSQSK
jgi:glycosyltransferase involved in cell wall biosynthesis